MTQVKDGSNANFIIYYLNYPKAVELCMTMGNVVQKGKTVTSGAKRAKGWNLGASGGAAATLPTSIPLADAGMGLEAGIESGSDRSHSIERTYEVKNTKSTYLKRLVQHAKAVSCGNELLKAKSGDLVYVEGVSLAPCKQGELVQMQLLRHDMFKGFRVEGIDVNNLVRSMLDDYAYVLFAPLPAREENETVRLAVKIPSENANEFESKYRMHDLLLGDVGLVGVYKGEVEAGLLTHTTFGTLLEMGSAQQRSDDGGSRVIKSAEYHAQPVSTGAPREETLEGKVHYLDLIAIIQTVSFDGRQVGDGTDPISGELAKPGIFSRLKARVRRG